MSDPVEQAAEAMCRADNPPTSLDDEESYEWDIKAMLEVGSEDGDYYRRMAAAAIATLGLTREWGVCRDGEAAVTTGLHEPMTEAAARQFASTSRRSKPVSRLVSRWVGEETKP